MSILYRATIYALLVTVGSSISAEPPQPSQTAAEVNELILAAEQMPLMQKVDEATFLRRVSLDVIGRPATAGEITRFGLTPSPTKRTEVVERLLASNEYGANWARYWRDVILMRATNVRSAIVRESFEEWMAESLNKNQAWDNLVEELLTATGSVTENGATALLFAHEGTAEEIAAEASRLFLGIQIQCANCHDHPWDRWKRDEFHEFAAFFPRVTVRRDGNRAWVVGSKDSSERRRFGVSDFLLTRIDKNHDQVISKQEAKRSPVSRVFNNERIMERIDKDGDGKLTIEELKTAQPANNNRPGQGNAEHLMPNLENPASEGTRMDPVFFLNDRKIKSGTTDIERRTSAAGFISSRRNEWFAKAIVNRMWAELTGTAFFAPVDDIGPDREANHEAALDVLCAGFISNRYDLKWLLQAIIATDIYQRGVNTDVDGFTRMEPTRLRSDQLYAVLCQALGVEELNLRVTDRRRYGRSNPGRAAIAATFGFDPSMRRDEVASSIPQALFLMNSPEINQLISGRRNDSPIGRITNRFDNDVDAVSELYLAVLGREPEEGELKVCLEFLKDSDNSVEAMEDLFWALLNSSEFQRKR